jgi:hypothetical protein
MPVMLRRMDSIASSTAAVRLSRDSLGFIAFNLHRDAAQHSTAQHKSGQHSTACWKHSSHHVRRMVSRCIVPLDHCVAACCRPKRGSSLSMLHCLPGHQRPPPASAAAVYTWEQSQEQSTVPPCTASALGCVCHSAAITSMLMSCRRYFSM